MGSMGSVRETLSTRTPEGWGAPSLVGTGQHREGSRQASSMTALRGAKVTPCTLPALLAFRAGPTHTSR